MCIRKLCLALSLALAAAVCARAAEPELPQRPADLDAAIGKLEGANSATAKDHVANFKNRADMSKVLRNDTLAKALLTPEKDRDDKQKQAVKDVTDLLTKVKAKDVKAIDATYLYLTRVAENFYDARKQPGKGAANLANANLLIERAIKQADDNGHKEIATELREFHKVFKAAGGK